MQLTRHAVLSLLIFCGSITCMILSGMVNIMMIGELNRTRPETSHISYIGYTPAKLLTILREYREQYPAGRLHIFAISLFVLGMALILIFGRMIGLPV